MLGQVSVDVGIFSNFEFVETQVLLFSILMMFRIVVMVDQSFEETKWGKSLYNDQLCI